MQDQDIRTEFTNYTNKMDKEAEDHKKELYKRLDIFMADIREATKPKISLNQSIIIALSFLGLFLSGIAFIWTDNQSTREQVRENTTNLKSSKESSQRVELWTNTFSDQLTEGLKDIAVIKAKQEVKDDLQN